MQGDCIELMSKFDFKFDMIFADPPYFLSNGGISVQSGKMVSVNKGDWDKSRGEDADHAFNREWLKAILNCVTWVKTNPPPNLSCRYFTHSAEYILWARKESKTPHFFNYELMKEINGGTQMRDVWTLPAIAKWEKNCGKHPTQKPLCVLSRIILASTQPGSWVLDPFAGSSTTGIAANLLGRRYLGMDMCQDFLDLSIKRKNEIEDPVKREEILLKLNKQSELYQDKEIHVLGEEQAGYGEELPF